jgi:hypothetical protein
MDLCLHRMIALERRDRWLQAAATARQADIARRGGGPVEGPLEADPSDPSAFFDGLLAPMPVPRVIWWHNGIGLSDEARAKRSARR